jgi:8-oxo-dGTP pyrophosphatase MutT (NUDIX family)
MPPATPRPASTILLLRDAPDGLEVFMVVRHHQIDFASGALVFPGGRVEAADQDLARRTGSNEHLLDFRIAAIRETFEECGVLLARSHDAATLVDGATLRGVQERHRQNLNAGSIDFEMILLQEGLVPATDLLVHFAHWITPAYQPKRYDTQFYLAEGPPEHLAVHDGHEAVESIWIRPADALAETAAGRYKLVFATAKNLEKLARHQHVAAAMDAARRSTVVTVEPVVLRTEGPRRLMQIPAEADYGGSEFLVDLPPASK